MEFGEALHRLRSFHADALTNRIATLETALSGAEREDCRALLNREGIAKSLWEAALAVKRAASQINVIIHAIGILLTLPSIVEPGETIESLSLGAGNTGKAFDLVTDHRLAEFSFIDWRGGPEAIRQNAVFDDFYRLAEASGEKSRFLYVRNIRYPLLFLQGRRALSSVLSRNQRLRDDFLGRYGARFARVCEYYQYRRDRGTIVDLGPIVSALTQDERAEPTSTTK